MFEPDTTHECYYASFADSVTAWNGLPGEDESAIDISIYLPGLEGDIPVAALVMTPAQAEDLVAQLQYEIERAKGVS